MQWFREKFGAAVVTVVIGLITLVFIFYGIYSPRNTRGMHEGAVAGTVNGEPISVREYQRSLNQRLEFFKNMAGGKITEEQLRAFHVQESVFRDLAQRVLMVQEAKKQGVAASDAAVKQAILEIPAFQKDGKFDLMTYKQTLEANSYTPGTFERVVRDDLSAQSWNEYFKRRVIVSDEEAKREFLVSHDKRNLKYVTLNAENGRKGITIGADAVQKFLADSAKLNLAKAQYEGKKQTEYKGKTFDEAKEAIARDLLAGENLKEASQIIDKLADQIEPLMKADKSSDAKIDALLKPYGAQVRTTGPFNRLSQFIPGIGEDKELAGDAFAVKSPIDPNQGGKAKKYSTPAARVVAVLIEAEHPDPAKFDSAREETLRNISLRKEHQLFDSWMKELMKKAKIDMNPDIVRGSEPAES